MARPEVKEKHQAATKLAMTPERIKKAADGAKKQWADNREKMVDIQRQKWIDPETRANMLTANRAKRVLTDDQVAEIRRRYYSGCSQKVLANEFGVSKTTLHRVVRNISTYQE